MVVQVGITIGENIKKFQGLSTDPKPIIDVGSGSEFTELDTGNFWQFDIQNINPQTGTGWWGF